MADEVHVADIGTIYELEFKEGGSVVNLSTFTTKEIFWLKPDGTTKVTNTAVFTTDGTDGKIRYVSTASSEINQAGTWKMQGHVFKTGEEHRSSIVTFPVINNLD